MQTSPQRDGSDLRSSACTSFQMVRKHYLPGIRRIRTDDILLQPISTPTFRCLRNWTMTLPSNGQEAVNVPLLDFVLCQILALHLDSLTLICTATLPELNAANIESYPYGMTLAVLDSMKQGPRFRSINAKRLILSFPAMSIRDRHRWEYKIAQ